MIPWRRVVLVAFCVGALAGTAAWVALGGY